MTHGKILSSNIKKIMRKFYRRIQIRNFEKIICYWRRGITWKELYIWKYDKKSNLKIWKVWGLKCNLINKKTIELYYLESWKYYWTLSLNVRLVYFVRKYKYSRSPKKWNRHLNNNNWLNLCLCSSFLFCKWHVHKNSWSQV